MTRVGGGLSLGKKVSGGHGGVVPPGTSRAPGEAGADNPARSGQWLNCGSGADGIPRPGQGDGGLSRWQADLLRRQVAQDVITHGKQPGTVPAGLLRWAEEVLSPKVNWRAVLAAEGIDASGVATVDAPSGRALIGIPA